MRVQKTIEIKATPKKTWLYFGEPGKVPRWYRIFREFGYSPKVLVEAGGSAVR